MKISAFELPSERFGFFELTDEHGGERMDRVPVMPGEIRIGDRGYLQANQLGAVMSKGWRRSRSRAGWRHARWRDANAKPLDLLALLAASGGSGLIDCAVWLGRKSGAPLAMRLVARKPPAAAVAARRKARLQARKESRQSGTLAAAKWVILVTSLSAADFSSSDIVKLSRLRWQIEPAFKRLKSVGLPPRADPRLAGPWVLSHLMIILLDLAAHRRVRRLSLLSIGRSNLWRVARQVTSTLVAAIIPQPNLITLGTTAEAFYYRLRKPPRRRKLQTMVPLSSRLWGQARP